MQLPARVRSKPGMALIAILALVLVVGGYWFFTSGPGWSLISPRGSTVATFSGDGDATTASFRVREAWRIEWDSKGSSFAMTISGDENMGTVVQVTEPENGVTAPPSKGTFHLELKAQGSWTIRILQGR